MQNQAPLPSIENREERLKLDSSTISQNRSYVSRMSRMTDGQTRAFKKGMDAFEIPSSQKSLQEELDDKIMFPYTQCVLDIGFGAGECINNFAQLHPSIVYVGVETYKPGIGSLFVKSLPNNVENILVHNGDAVKFMFYQIDNNSLDRIQVFFPDPWPKARHNKRRLIQVRFLQLCHALLKPQGILWIVTDWQPYAEHIDHQIAEFNSFYTSNFQCDGLQINHALQEQLESERIMTKFEQKGINKGHTIYPTILQKP